MNLTSRIEYGDSVRITDPNHPHCGAVCLVLYARGPMPGYPVRLLWLLAPGGKQEEAFRLSVNSVEKIEDL